MSLISKTENWKKEFGGAASWCCLIRKLLSCPQKNTKNWFSTHPVWSFCWGRTNKSTCQMTRVILLPTQTSCTLKKRSKTPQNYHRFASSLIHPKKKGSHLIHDPWMITAQAHLPTLCRSDVVSHHYAMVTHIKGRRYTSITSGAVDGHEVLLALKAKNGQ